MPRGIDQIELIVRNVDETVAFFQTLGFALLTRTPRHGGSAELKLPGEGQIIFEIHTVQGEENPGVNHIAFRCDELASRTHNHASTITHARLDGPAARQYAWRTPMEAWAILRLRTAPVPVAAGSGRSAPMRRRC